MSVESRDPDGHLAIHENLVDWMVPGTSNKGLQGTGEVKVFDVEKERAIYSQTGESASIPSGLYVRNSDGQNGFKQIGDFIVTTTIDDNRLKNMEVTETRNLDGDRVRQQSFERAPLEFIDDAGMPAQLRIRQELRDPLNRRQRKPQNKLQPLFMPMIAI